MQSSRKRYRVKQQPFSRDQTQPSAADDAKAAGPKHKSAKKSNSGPRGRGDAQKVQADGAASPVDAEDVASSRSSDSWAPPAAKRAPTAAELRPAVNLAPKRPGKPSALRPPFAHVGLAEDLDSPLPLLTQACMGSGLGFCGRLDKFGSRLSYDPGFCQAPQLLKQWKNTILGGTPWMQGRVTVYGKEFPEPRLTCYFGDRNYSYSGRTVRAQPFASFPALQEVREAVQRECGNVEFDSCLLNRYRNGDDTVGWHSDAESGYGPEPMIAVVTFGATRDFDLREKAKQSHRLRLSPSSGSLFVMAGPTQRFWHHAVPRRKRVVGDRVSLTFRRFVS